MSLITLCLTGDHLTINKDHLITYADRIDLAELRLDCLSSLKVEGRITLNEVESFVRRSPVPLILTIRRECDGGFFQGDEKERLELLTRLIPLGFAYVDLEDDLEPNLAAQAEEAARSAQVRIIRSFHDFQGLPEDLVDRVRRNGKAGELSKAAVTLSHSRDIIPFLEAARELEGQEKILLAMGERGFFSRILTEKIGSFLSFTSPAEGLTAAPGQLDPDVLLNRYRFRKQQADWPLYGIIGNPIIQSRSPELHNRWLEEAGLPGIYVPFLLDDMEDFARIDQLLGFQGLSVTIPFKEKILAFADQPSEAVKAIGACNTYYRDGEIHRGENTDAPGFLYPLLDSMGIERKAHRPLEGKKCLVVGAGGSSRAILFALTRAGAEVLLLNRTVEKAEKLAREFGSAVQAGVLSAESLPLMKEYGQIIVQTTSAGMPPQEERDPLDFYEFTGNELVYDIVYKPPVTVMMARAEKAGCSVLGGWNMLREQGIVQFELFTGQPVPKGKA
ncbi:MAG: shikimate dehydrogenase [Spirochaetales bacterium]|nr:shikimate dehydrogenase [Spirochaetales bacterium]